MQFDATETLGALAKLPPETPKPVEPATTAGGIWRAARNAVPAAVAESAAMVAKGASIAFDDSPDNRGPVRQFGEEVERSLRNVAESYAPDPMTASKAEQVVFGLTRGVGKAVGYGLTTGPAAPLLFGVDEGLTEREKLIRQGVDEATAGKVGMVAGAVNMAGFAIPAAGSTVARTIGLATLAGPASFVAQQAGSREILRAADYGAIASSYDPTDALGLALSAIPFGFGAWAMRGRFKTGKPAPEAMPAPDTAPVAPDAIPVEPVRAADVSGVSPDIAPASPDVVARSPDIVPEPIVRQEHVDAAMVKNLVDFEDGVKANPPEKFDAELSRAEVTGADDFKAWFKGSKVTGENGQPLLMYRGTANEDGAAHPNGLVFLTDRADFAVMYAERVPEGKVMPVYVKAQQAFDASRGADRELWSEFQLSRGRQWSDDIQNTPRGALPRWNVEREFRAWLDENGVEYDGIWFAENDGSASLGVRAPDQLRSAVSTSGKLDALPPSAFKPTTKETPADVPAPEKLGTETREAPAPEGKAEGVQIPEGTGPDSAVIKSVRTRADQVVLEAPGLVVGVDENGAIITAKEALEKIRREAQEGTENELGAADAPLLDVAVQCALSVGQ